LPFRVLSAARAARAESMRFIIVSGAIALTDAAPPGGMAAGGFCSVRQPGTSSASANTEWRTLMPRHAPVRDTLPRSPLGFARGSSKCLAADPAQRGQVRPLVVAELTIVREGDEQHAVHGLVCHERCGYEGAVRGTRF
jgi:hypothetical protein